MFLPLCLLAQRQQRSWEIPFFIGGANYVGDLAPDVVPQETRPAVGIGLKRNFSGYFGAGLHATYGSIAGDDKNFAYLAPRGLSFESEIFELSPQLEFNFFRFGSGYRSARFSPYLYTGAALFYFNPKRQFQDRDYYLQPQGTEGQGVIDGEPDPYSLYNFAVLFGAGFKYQLADQWVLALHGAYRSSFTDYLDDVRGTYPDFSQMSTISAALSDPTEAGIKGRQRGSIDTRDWYIFAGFTLSYVLRGSPCYTF